jgi:hypothetical protein
MAQMEPVRETKLAIIYLDAILTDLSLVGTRKAMISYSQLHQNYTEAQRYLQKFSASDKDIAILVAELPDLVRSNIFNAQLEGTWLLVIPGCIIPLFAVALVVLTAPVSIPYFIIRMVVVRRTKSRISEAKFALTQVVNKLRDRLAESFSA